MTAEPTRLREQIADCDASLARSGGEVAAERLVADTLFEKGYLLGELERFDEEIDCYEEIVARFGDSDSLELRRQVARALHAKGCVCRELGRTDVAASAFAEAVARMGDCADPELRGRVIEVLYQHAYLLVAAGRAAEARDVLAALLEPYPDTDPPAAVLGVFVTALALSGEAEAMLGDDRGATERCDEVVRRYQRFAEPEIRSPVAWAMTCKAAVVGRCGSPRQAVKLLDAALAHIGDPVTPELRERAAEALRFRGNWLEWRRRRKQALADYREVLERFADDESEIIDLQRARARERIEMLSGH